MKKQLNIGGSVPQDEEELNKMVHYWEDVLQTKTLKVKEEEEIMKKLSSLEQMRSSIGDFSNISKEIVNLRKKLQSVKSKVDEEKTHLNRINEGVKENTDLIDG